MLQLHEEHTILVRRLERPHELLALVTADSGRELNVRYPCNLERFMHKPERQRRFGENEELFILPMLKNLSTLLMLRISQKNCELYLVKDEVKFRRAGVADPHRD
jgi:hypothetical protein